MWSLKCGMVGYDVCILWFLCLCFDMYALLSWFACFSLLALWVVVFAVACAFLIDLAMLIPNIMLFS